MKRYDASNTIRVVLPEYQKAWLRQQASDMRTISDVIRQLIKQAMVTESK
jgi:hypothetical protein